MNRQLILLIASLIAVVVLALYVFNIEPRLMSSSNNSVDEVTPTTPDDGFTPPPPTLEDTMPTTPPPTMPTEDDATGEQSTTLESANDGDSAEATNRPAADATVAYVAETDGVSTGTITIISVSDTMWPNGCLGLAGEGEMCTQAIVPGFIVTLDVAGDTRVFRTDIEGTTIREETTGN